MRLSPAERNRDDDQDQPDQHRNEAGPPARPAGVPPSDHPRMNISSTATAFESAIASRVSRTTIRGTIIGNVDKKTSRNTPAAPRKSPRVGVTLVDDNRSLRRCRRTSISDGVNASASGSGRISSMIRCAAPGSAAPRIAPSAATNRARVMNVAIRYIAASTSPHARLQPIAPASTVLRSSRPASAMRIEPVNVSTMMIPKRISEVRSSGSSTRRGTGLIVYRVASRWQALGDARARGVPAGRVQGAGRGVGTLGSRHPESRRTSDDAEGRRRGAAGRPGFAVRPPIFLKHPPLSS